MTQVTLTLPDTLAQQARQAGLLSDGAIQKLLEDAVRRSAGQKLLAAARQLQALKIPSITDAEIVAQVKAVRAERRVRRDKAHSRKA